MLILQKLRGKKNTVGKGAKMPYVNNSEFGKYTARRHSTFLRKRSFVD